MFFCISVTGWQFSFNTFFPIEISFSPPFLFLFLTLLWFPFAMGTPFSSTLISRNIVLYAIDLFNEDKFV